MGIPATWRSLFPTTFSGRAISRPRRPGLPEFISYTAYSEIFEPDQATLRGVSREQYTRFFENETSGEYFRVHFLQIPTSLDPRIRSLAADITKDATTPYDEVVAIKDYLENHLATKVCWFY